MHTCELENKEKNLTLERSCTPDEGRSGTAPSPRSGTENKFSTNASLNHEKRNKIEVFHQVTKFKKGDFLTWRVGTCWQSCRGTRRGTALHWVLSKDSFAKEIVPAPSSPPPP